MIVTSSSKRESFSAAFAVVVTDITETLRITEVEVGR